MRTLVLIAGLVVASSVHAGARGHEIPFEKAKDIALMVASHDHIQVDDRNVVLDSMDTRNEAGFIPGYYSFSVVRESDSPAQPDQTIRMYVVSKRTAEIWEMNLCQHYSFPELRDVQRSVMHETGATIDDDRDMPKAIGCTTTQAEAQETP